MKIKLVLFALILGVMAASQGMANPILISLDAANQAGRAGATLVFYGVITNTGGDPIFLNAVDLNLAGSSFNTGFVDQFFNNVPISLDGGTSSGSIELFRVTLLNPFTDSFVPYAGTYTLFGGLDGGAQDFLAQADFNITATPEPSSALLLIAGLALLGYAKRRYETT